MTTDLTGPELPVTGNLPNGAEVEQKAAERMEQLMLLPAVRAAFSYIEEQGLKSKGYAYHFGHEDHTTEVIRDAILFAEYNNALIETGSVGFDLEDVVTEEEFELLAIAAAGHDTGFGALPREVNGKGHEEHSAQNAARFMEGHYSPEQIARVQQMVRDTVVRMEGDSMQVSSGDKLSKFLLDADVSNFGRDDFFEKSDFVAQEVQTADRGVFDSFALNFLLKRHHWQTAAARLLRADKERENVAFLEEKLKRPLNTVS